MKLSIIVPVYNMASGGKLNYCLDSLVNQTLTDYEILAVDDCSTDESYSIMKEYQEKVIITEECWEENFEYEGVETYSDNWDAEVNAAQDLIRYHWRDVYDALIKKYREPRLLYLSLLQTQERSESLKWVENGMFPIAGGL